MKKNASLSAGRVQSVVVKLIIERENAIKEFEAEPFYKISGTFDLPISKKKSLKPDIKFVERVGRPTKRERRQTDRLMGRD